MTGRFIYEFEGVTFSSIYWADIYKAMLNDARHTGAGVYCCYGLLICRYPMPPTA